jgi:cysteine synthase
MSGPAPGSPADLARPPGDTPLVHVEGVWVKLECANPGGSIKDRIARFMLEQAFARGELGPGDTVVETSSGNTGIALAMAGRAMDVRVVIFMPEHMSVERRRMIERLGAEVRLTPRAEGFAGAVERRDAWRGRAGHWVPDQFTNPDNARCHEFGTGPELIAQLAAAGAPAIDAFVAGVGTGGTLMGVSRALRRVMPHVRRVAVEPEESAVMLGRPAGEHGIMGIGDGFIPGLMNMDEVDAVEAVSTAEAFETADRIRHTHGFCVGISSGANFAAARRLAAAGARVATVWADRADRYVSVGLGDAGSHGTTCDLRACCAGRTRAVLGAEPTARS